MAQTMYAHMNKQISKINFKDLKKKKMLYSMEYFMVRMQHLLWVFLPMKESFGPTPDISLWCMGCQMMEGNMARVVTTSKASFACATAIVNDHNCTLPLH
jgi:hypothetical protein